VPRDVLIALTHARGKWHAIALDYNVAATGHDEDDARTQLTRLLQAQFEAATRHGLGDPKLPIARTWRWRLAFGAWLRDKLGGRAWARLPRWDSLPVQPLSTRRSTQV
jgi:hypothetical protein